MLMAEWSSVAKPLIGMIHLGALPGSPGYRGSIDALRAAALHDAEALVEGGIDGLLIENYGDAPFFPGRVPPHTVAHLTALAAEVSRRFSVPLGVNVLRNDGLAALAVAQAVGARFIRVNVLSGARLTDQGLIQGIAHHLTRLRSALGAGAIQIWADVNVKHSAPLAPCNLSDEVADLVRRGGADALIVSGQATGREASLEELGAVRAAAGDTPVLVGSGVSPETIVRYLPHADGFIVGTSLKEDGVTDRPVDLDRVKALAEKLR
jgi:hypothetical protein